MTGKCAKCGEILVVPGMVILSPPLPHSDLVKRYDICVACASAVETVALASYPIAPYRGMSS